MKSRKQSMSFYRISIIIIFLFLIFITPKIFHFQDIFVNKNNQSNSNDQQTNNPTSYPLLKVNGRDIVNENGDEVKLTGFFIWTSSIIYEPEDLKNELLKIKESGFNTILIAISWSYHIEPGKDAPGVYDLDKINLIENIVKEAQNQNLYVILGLRVSSSSSTSKPDDFGGWGYADLFSPHYTSEWNYYFERYLKAWEFLIRRLDGYYSVIGYNPWFYPFHGVDPDTGDWHSPVHKIDHYEKYMTPMFQSMLRNNTEKIFFWTPVDQGKMMTQEIYQLSETGYLLGELVFDPTSSTGQYQPGFNRTSILHDQDVNRELLPLNDTNVVYCAGGHRPLNVERTEQPPYSWNGTEIQKQYINATFEPLWKFCEKYNVPGMITEMGMFNDPWGAEQWRIDAYDYKMHLLSKLDIHWLYMWDGREIPVDLDGNWNNIGEMLIRNIPK